MTMPSVMRRQHISSGAPGGSRTGSALAAAVLGAIDRAYRSKYARYGGTYVDPMVSPGAAAATLRLNAR